MAGAKSPGMPDIHDANPVIPRPQAVRDRLAVVHREAELLRAQLRVSRKAAEEQPAALALLNDGSGDAFQQLSDAARKLTADQLRDRLAMIDHERRVILGLLREVRISEQRRTKP